MRGWGLTILVVGIIWVLSAMNMDVSIGTGLGRVNNFGLMAQRQNLIMIGGFISLGGLLMVILARRRPVLESDTAVDTRPCPMCAEPIRREAIKCKHCGADVEPKPSFSYGRWFVKIKCSTDADQERVKETLGNNYPYASQMGNVVVGPYGSEKAAEEARHSLSQKHQLSGSLFKD